MKLGMINVAVSALGILSCKTPAKSLNLQIDFRGQELVNTIITAPTEDSVLADFKRALTGGKISINYITPAAAGGGVTMINNRVLSDVAEIYSAIDQNLVIRHLGNQTVGGEDFSNFRASFNILLSRDGTVPLGENASVDIDFSGFTNPVITGLAANACNPIIAVDTLVVPQRATNLLILEGITATVGNASELQIHGRDILAIPADTEKLLLHSPAGGMLEITDDNIDGFAESCTKPHTVVCGCVDFYYQWLVIPCAGYSHGTIETNSTDKVYALHNHWL